MDASDSVTHKERALAAFEHRQADRIPMFEQGVASDVASGILGREAFTGTVYLHYQEACAWMNGEQAHEEFDEQVRQDVVALARALDFDLLRMPWRKRARPAKQIDEYSFVYGDPEGEHTICRFDPSSKAFGEVRTVGGGQGASPDDLEPEVERAERSAADYTVDGAAEQMSELALWQKEYGDEYAVVGGGGITVPLNEKWLMACALRPDLVKRSLEAQLQKTLVQFEAQARMGIRIIWGGGDLADKNGPVYGPVVFKDIVLPYVRRMTEKCRELGLYYLFRTDGNLWPIENEFFVQSGINGYGEIDYEAGMSIPDLKGRYGDELTFWGNVPCGTLLLNGTPGEIGDFTRDLIDHAAPGGGFILGSSNTIMPNTPPENALAMFETGRDYGRC
jgi:hypothetical protein